MTRRYAVGAHYGLMDWLLQRLSAVVMAVYTLLVLAIVLWNGGIDHSQWTDLFAHGGFKLASFLRAPVRSAVWCGRRCSIALVRSSQGNGMRRPYPCRGVG